MFGMCGIEPVENNSQPTPPPPPPPPPPRKKAKNVAGKRPWSKPTVRSLSRIGRTAGGPAGETNFKEGQHIFAEYSPAS